MAALLTADESALPTAVREARDLPRQFDTKHSVCQFVSLMRKLNLVTANS